jgi:hypothetical protein
MLGVSQTMDMVNTQMSKHGKLVNLLMKLHFIEDAQRSVKEIRQQIECYEKSSLELVSKWPNDMPEWVRNEKYNIGTKIRELKWTIYDN